MKNLTFIKAQLLRKKTHLIYWHITLIIKLKHEAQKKEGKCAVEV